MTLVQSFKIFIGYYKSLLHNPQISAYRRGNEDYYNGKEYNNPYPKPNGKALCFDWMGCMHIEYKKGYYK